MVIVPGTLTALLIEIGAPDASAEKLIFASDPDPTVRLPLLMVEFLLPVVVLYVTLEDAPLLLAAKAIAPLWVILLFEIKLMLDPLAPLIAPLWMMPLAAPVLLAPITLPVTLMLPPTEALLIVRPLISTTVAAAPDVVPMMLMLLPVMVFPG